jgi:hypothetical protein
MPSVVLLLRYAIRSRRAFDNFPARRLRSGVPSAAIYGGELLSQWQLVNATPSFGLSIPLVLEDAFGVQNKKDEDYVRSITDEDEFMRCRIKLLETCEITTSWTFRYNQSYDT